MPVEVVDRAGMIDPASVIIWPRSRNKTVGREGKSAMTETTQMTQGLIDRAAAGDGTARHELLERYRDYLRRMVAARLDRRLAPRVDASDIVQDTLADAARRMDDYLRDRPLPFFGWLRNLAGERIVDMHRRHLTRQRRSVNRESRIPDLCDDSADAFARSFIAQDTSPSNRLLHKEQLEQVMAALADALAARPRGARHAAPRTVQPGRDRRRAGDQRGRGQRASSPRRHSPAEQAGGPPMNTNGTDLSSEDEIDATLADLTAEIIGRLECGEPVKPGDYAQAYPDYVHEIDRLLPTVNTLVALGRTVARTPQA